MRSSHLQISVGDAQRVQVVQALREGWELLGYLLPECGAIKHKPVLGLWVSWPCVSHGGLGCAIIRHQPALCVHARLTD